MEFITAPFRYVGALVLGVLEGAGAITIFLVQAVAQLFTGKRSRQLIGQCVFVGVESLPIVLLTAFFTGAVLALQSYIGLNSGMGASLGGGAIATSYLGFLVSTSMLRELGPVLASLMVASRVGAAMAAELGTMRVTEQIDALFTLATNPIRYLVVPRILACVLMLPLLVILGNGLGIFGGYAVSVWSLDIPGPKYMDSAMSAISGDGIFMALVKAAIFGLLVGLMSTYHGFNARGGAQGVGEATTKAVVYSAVSILISDYFITAIL